MNNSKEVHTHKVRVIVMIIPKHRLQYVLIKEILEEGKNLILAGDFKINLVVINLIRTIMAELRTCYVCYVIAGSFCLFFVCFTKVNAS